MKFSLRTMLGFTATVAMLVAIPVHLHKTVIPENRLIASELVNDIGARFEGNGVFPQTSILYRNDISDGLDLPLVETASGQLTNRWGQFVEVTPVLLTPGSGKSLYLELTVTSTGPFGLLGPVSVSRMYEYVFAGKTTVSETVTGLLLDERPK